MSVYIAVALAPGWRGGLVEGRGGCEVAAKGGVRGVQTRSEATGRLFAPRKTPSPRAGGSLEQAIKDHWMLIVV